MSDRIFIEEATKARESLHAELSQAMQNGRKCDEWMTDRFEMLAYYTRMLQKLGVLPQG